MFANIVDRWRNLKRISVRFILLVCLNAGCWIAMTRMTFIQYDSVSFERINHLTTYVLTQIMIFSWFMGCMGVWDENLFQVIGYFAVQIESAYLASIVLGTASIYDKAGIWKDVSKRRKFDPEIRIVAGVYLGILFLQLCSFTVLYRAMGWRFYRTIGTDISLKKLYQIYQTLVMSLQIDLQYTIRGLIQLYWFAIRVDQFESYLWCPIIITILEFFWLILIRKGVISESPKLLFAGVICSSSALGIWAYFYSVFVNSTSSRGNRIIFQFESGQVTLLAWFIFVSRSFSIIMSLISYRNFSKGLKDRVFPKITIELFMGGSLLHPYRPIEDEELRTRLSLQDRISTVQSLPNL